MPRRESKRGEEMRVRVAFGKARAQKGAKCVCVCFQPLYSTLDKREYRLLFGLQKRKLR